MNSVHFSKSTAFTINSALFSGTALLVKKHVFVVFMNCAHFFPKQVFTTNYTLCGWESFWDLFSTGRGQWQSKAEPSRAEPARAEPSRAEPGRTGPGRAEPGRAELS